MVLRRAILWGVVWSVPLSPPFCGRVDLLVFILQILFLFAETFFLLCLAWCCGDQADLELAAPLQAGHKGCHTQPRRCVWLLFIVLTTC